MYNKEKTLDYKIHFMKVVYESICDKFGRISRKAAEVIGFPDKDKEAWLIFFIIFATANGSQFFFEATWAKIGDTPNPEIASNRLSGTPHD